MKQFHRFQKFMAALMVFTMLFGSVPAWAGADVTINATGTVTPNTWSNTPYVGVDGKVTTIGTDVINSIKTNQPTTTHVYGIKYGGTGTLSVGSLAGGINFDSNSSAYGIYANNTGKTKVSGVGEIKAKGASYGYGIYSKGTGKGFENNVSFVSGSTINASGNNSGANGIYAQGIGTTTVSNLGEIYANTSGNYSTSYGIYSWGSDANFKNNVSFSGAGGYINATTVNADANGIYTKGAGTTIVSNLGSIEIKTSGLNKQSIGIRNGTSSDDTVVMNATFANGGKIRATGTGNTYGIYAQGNETTVSNLSSIEAKGMYTVNGIYSCASANTSYSTYQVTKVNFSGAGSYINATGTGTDDKVYGIGLVEKGKAYITELGGITANGSKYAYGIYTCSNIDKGPAPYFENNVSFNNSGTGSYINVTSTGGEAYGIFAFKEGKTTVTNVGSIEANGSTKAYGIYSCGSNTGLANNVSFTGTNPTIKATSASGEAYGIGAYMNGTTTVSNVGSITAEAKAADEKAYGIYSKGDDAGFANNVSFVASGGTIKATSTAAACGIGAFKKGTTTVTNVGGIEANGSTNTYGVRSCSSDASLQNNVTFVNGGKITAIGTSGNASGISAEMKGTTTVKNVGGITANGVVNAYGIHSNGTADTLANNVSFKGNGGQAITATATDAANAYSIFVAGQGATTVSFEDSILSGKIHQQDTATLTLNFNNGGVWTPTAAGVVGNISVNMMDGSTLDTRVATGVAQNKTINLGTGTFTAAPGSKISFDAVTANNGLTTDQIKAQSGSGTIELGTVNVTDSAKSEWTKPKYATLFVDSDSKGLTGIEINGSTTTATDNGYIYTFTGVKGGAGNVSATSESKVKFTLPELIQGTKEEKGMKAGEIDTFSITKTEVYKLDAELGTLNNNQREQFTIYGNGKGLSANTSFGGGVTIKSGDTLNVTDITVDGFTQFATNAGTLNLDGVTFTGTTGSADVINNGTLNLNTTATTFDKGVSGNGETNVNVDTDMKTAALSQGKVTVADGITLTTAAELTAANGVANNGTVDVAAANLKSNITNNGTVKLGAGELGNYSITGGKIVTGDNITANAANIATAEITNANTLSLTGGNSMETAVELKGDILGANGITEITGFAGTQKKIKNALNINASSAFANKGTISGAVTVAANGALVTTADGITGGVANEGEVELISGALASDITGAGETIISGTVSSAKTIANKVTVEKDAAFDNSGTLNGATTVNANATLTNTGTLAADVTNAGAVTTTVAGLAGNVSNSNGTVTFTTGGTLAATITGGTVVTGGNTNASVTNLLADDVYNKYTLTLTGTGTLNENIWDEGGVKGTVKMNAKEITVADNKTIENNIEYLGTDAIDVELKDGSAIAGTVKAPEGSKIIVDGNGVTNAADQTLDVVVNETKDLTTTKKLAGNITLMDDAELTATASGAKLGNGSATNISVGKNAKLTALATNINADIYNASDKSVHLTGGTLSKNIRESGTTYIEGDTTFANGITVENKVYVDNGKSLSAANPFTLANTLYFEGGSKQSTVNNVSTTGTLAFVLTGANKDKAIVKATNGYNITGAKVALYQADEALYDRLDVVKLMEGATGSYTSEMIKAKYGDESILRHKYKTYLEGEELLAKYLGTGATEEAKSFSEGRLAGATALTTASDLLAGSGLSAAVAAAQRSTNGYAPYVEIAGSHGKFNSGSHIDLNSLNVVAGLAKKVGDCTTVGAYIEGGNSRYASYNEFSTGEIRADGDINYFGAGIFAHYAFNATEKGNAYVDGAFGAGHTTQDYATDSALLDSARYDASSAYLKAHATVGYNFNVAKDAKIDTYAKYLWARQGADSVTVGTDPINFDSINSNRLRAGFRYTQGIKKTLAWYGGLAYEYEFSAKAKASSYGFAIGEPDLIGGSGMAELGLKFAPLNAHGWRFDAGLQGFLGKRDSLGVRLGAWYEF